MSEVARILAFASVVLMAISFAIWSNRLRGPLLERLDGQRASNAAPATLAITLLMVAFGISAVAAVLAIGGWIAP
ncbi:hypothetical protein LZ016_07255 [Sphingomonas sp. SM33]|uniref:DUF2970 domain-containing protein n=1 Tax=Sphingomonas telluris TaxID=2907998 RepID=A0ABS9VLQ5_9SPHN|nr:hypothetical protein [Sphingomonas telluris]MCH8615895.1 hypothetical protein [Sphingomonas telluris]